MGQIVERANNSRLITIIPEVTKIYWTKKNSAMIMKNWSDNFKQYFGQLVQEIDFSQANAILTQTKIIPTYTTNNSQAKILPKFANNSQTTKIIPSFTTSNNCEEEFYVNFKCGQCDFVGKTRGGLTKHVNAKHGNGYVTVVEEDVEEMLEKIVKNHPNEERTVIKTEEEL